MLIVRDVFTAKPGQASKLAKLFKKVMVKNGNMRVLTDLIGDFNTVVMEAEVENLGEYEKMMEDYRSGKLTKDLDAETAAAMSKYSELFSGGRREILQVME